MKLLSLQNNLKFSETRYEVFDVYNNGFESGGRLQIAFDRHLLLGSNSSIVLTDSQMFPETIHRKFLNDVTVRVGVLVREIRWL